MRAIGLNHVEYRTVDAGRHISSEYVSWEVYELKLIYVTLQRLYKLYHTVLCANRLVILWLIEGSESQQTLHASVWR